MKFGKSYADVKTEPTSGGNGFMKYFKKGDTTFRIVQEPEEWVGYWEHYNPGGFPFPCNSEDRKNCPGCQSDNEKMKKASRKIAVNVLEGEFVNVYKMPKTVADKLDNRAQRNGTITDRDYTISRIEGRNADGSTKTDYDIEGQDKTPVDVTKLELKDIEQMLQDAYEEAWGSSDKAKQTEQKNKDQQGLDNLKEKLAKVQAEQGGEPPFDEAPVHDGGNIYDETDLRGMDKSGILAVCEKEGLSVPNEVQLLEPSEIVDWMLNQDG